MKPSSKSNKQKIQNAITQSVFPGAVNSEMKNKILQVILSVMSQFFFAFEDQIIGIPKYKPIKIARTMLLLSKNHGGIYFALPPVFLMSPITSCYKARYYVKNSTCAGGRGRGRGGGGGHGPTKLEVSGGGG